MTMNIIEIFLRGIQTSKSTLPNNAQLSEKTKSTKAPVTLRLSEKSAEFYERQAMNLNTTPSSLINMVLNTVADSTDSEINNRYAQTILCIRERLQLIFDWHLLDVFQVHALYLEFCQTQNKEPLPFHNIGQILEQIDPNFIEYVCDEFYISVNWVIGKSDDIYETKDSWYLNHKQFCKNVLGFSEMKAKPILHFVLGDNISTHEALESENEELKAGAYISYAKELHGRSVRVYKPFELERWNYKKCRIRLKMISLFGQHAAKLGVDISQDSAIISADALRLYNASKLHPSQLPRQQMWLLDDYIDIQLPVTKEANEIDAVYSEYNHSGLVQFMVEQQHTCMDKIQNLATLLPITANE